MRPTVQTSSERFSSQTGWDLHYPHVLKMYYFSFRTPEQGSDVAAHIASFCPMQNSFLELGLNEIFLNAIEHGNLGITDEEKNTYKNSADWQKMIYQKLRLPQNLSKKVKVIVEITPAYTSVEVTDEGKGFDWKNAKPNKATPLKKNGRGLLLASELCFNSIEFVGKGNIVRCLCWH